MKFLLTSAGIVNKSIEKAFFELVEKKAQDITLAFIPTAANVEEGDKSWLITDLYNLKNRNFKCIDVVDISALEQKIWKPRLELADVLVFSGGNTFHLMYWLKKSSLAHMLLDLLKTRVYVGISAGSMVTTKNLVLSQSKQLYYENLPKNYSNEGLGFFNFHFRPHLNSPDFPNVRHEFLKKIAKELKDPIYALDDQSALKIQDEKIEVISEGEYIII